MIGIRPRWTWLRIPAEATNYQQIVQTVSEAHPTSCLLVTRPFLCALNYLALSSPSLSMRYKTLIVTDYINSPRRHTSNTHKFPQIKTHPKTHHLCLYHIWSILKNLYVHKSLYFIIFHILTTPYRKRNLVFYDIALDMCPPIFSLKMALKN